MARPLILASSLLLALGCSTAPPPAEVCFARVKEGMSLKAMDEALAPVLVSKGFCYAGSIGVQSFLYHLKGGLEFGVHTRWYPNHEQAESISPLRPKERWFGVFFEPSPEDRNRAFEIAVGRVREALREGIPLGGLFPTAPGGRRVGGHTFRVDLELQPGTPETVEVSCGLAAWRTHRLLAMDFLKPAAWLFQVTVDLDEGKVVPTQWNPTPGEVVRARTISDTLVR